jgi:hypothetical protein
VPLADPRQTKASLLAILLRRLRSKGAFDANKLYSSELLAILLQGHPENQRRLGWCGARESRGGGLRAECGSPPCSVRLADILGLVVSLLVAWAGASAFQLATASGVHSVDGVEMVSGDDASPAGSFSRAALLPSASLHAPFAQLLEVLNQYKKRSPESTEEEECVENVFDALCTALVSRIHGCLGLAAPTQGSPHAL